VTLCARDIDGLPASTWPPSAGGTGLERILQTNGPGLNSQAWILVPRESLAQIHALPA
jgi:hypothetical protein